MAAAQGCLRFLLIFAATWAAESRAAAQASQPSSTVDAPQELTKSVIEALGRLPRQQGVAALIAALDRGLPDELIDAALSALGAQGGDEATTELLDFTHHRRPRVRIASYEALAAALGIAAAPHLSAGLGDSDARVRESCANAMKDLPNFRADEHTSQRLLAALDRGDNTAASTFAAVSATEALGELGDRLQSLPLPVLLEAFAIALQRPDVPLKMKLAMVGQLRDQGTPAVRRFLTTLVSNEHIRKDEALRSAIVRAIAVVPKALKGTAP